MYNESGVKYREQLGIIPMSEFKDFDSIGPHPVRFFDRSSKRPRWRSGRAMIYHPQSVEIQPDPSRPESSIKHTIFLTGRAINENRIRIVETEYDRVKPDIEHPRVWFKSSLSLSQRIFGRSTPNQ